MNEANSKPMPRKILQPHGGALFSSGVPSHPGAGGRPPSAPRDRLRGTVEERVEILEEILDDPETSSADKMRCIDMLLKYSIGTKVELEVEQQVATIDPEELRSLILERALQVRTALPSADDTIDD